MISFISKYFTWILFAVITCFFLFFNINIRKQSSEHKLREKLYADSIANYQTVIKDLALFQKYEISSSGNSILQDITLESIHGNKTSFETVVNKTYLIYRFTESDCIDCMEQQFLYIQELLSNMNFDNIILIGNFPSRHNIEAFKETFGIEWPVFNYTEKLNLPIEDLNLPYFFVVNSDMKAYNFRVASGVTSLILENYLLGIENMMTGD